VAIELVNILSKPGVYRIVNVITGMFYVGSSRRVRCRLLRHLRFLRENRHGNSYLQNSWNFHGEQSFRFEIIQYCDNFLEIEQVQLNKFFPQKVLFNVETKAGVWSEERLKSLSSKAGGKMLTVEHKRKIGQSQRGRKHTEQSRKNMSAARMGHVVSIETRLKLGRVRGFLGHKHTEASRLKISNALKHAPRFQV
jgi:group I intron endonuclease